MISGSSKSKKLSFYVLMTVLTIASSLLLAEIVLRLSGKVAVQGLHTASEGIFEKIPGMFEPGQNFIYRKKSELPFHISINSLGYRGEEIERIKKEGVIRILCIGDSTTFGDFVDDDQTFPYKLQQIFNKKEKSVEVINGGVGGTTIIDQFLILKKSMEIVPDVVILTFFLNDIPNLNRLEPLYISFEKNRKLKSSSLSGLIYRTFGDTALFQLALKARSKYRMYYQRTEQSQKNNLFDPITFENEILLRKQYEKTLNKLYAFLKKHSTKLMLVILPSHHLIGEGTEFSDLQDLRIQWVEGLAQDREIPTVNLLRPFKESGFGKNDLHLLPYDGHHSPFAYDIQAEMVFKNLHKYFVDLFDRRYVLRYK